MSGKVWGTGLYFSGWVMICIFRYEVQTGIDRWPRDPEPYVAILFVAWSKSFLTQIFSIRPTSNLLDLCLVAHPRCCLVSGNYTPSRGPHGPQGWLSVHHLPLLTELQPQRPCVSSWYQPSSLGLKNLCNACSLAWRDLCPHLLTVASLILKLTWVSHSLERPPWATWSKEAPNLSVYILHDAISSWHYLVSKKYVCVLFFSVHWNISLTGRRTLPIQSHTASLACRTVFGHGGHYVDVCWVTELRMQGIFHSSAQSVMMFYTFLSRLLLPPSRLLWINIISVPPSPRAWETVLLQAGIMFYPSLGPLH